MARPSLEDDLGPDALAREQLEQDRVRDPAVDDVGLRGPALERPQRRLDLRQHPARDHPGRHEPLGLLATQRADQPLLAVENPLNIREVDQFLGGERRGDLSGDRSEEHTSELQSLAYLVCRLLLEKKKKNK